MKIEKRPFHQLLEEDNSEYLKMWDKDKISPILMNVRDTIEFGRVVKLTQELIQNSSNPRIIVLETWLLVDFIVRHLLITGLELHRYESNDFQLLPNNFKDCISLLKKLRNNQNNKEPLPASEKRIKLPGEFLKIIYKDKLFMDQFLKYEKEYYEKYYPECLDDTMFMIEIDFTKYRVANEIWLTLVNKLDDEWFVFAEKINTVRNKAAHSLDEQEIYKGFGINGKDQLLQLKKVCKIYLTDFLGLSSNSDKVLLKG